MNGWNAPLIDTVAWICVQDGRVLGVRSHGVDAFYVPGGKREPGETDLETLAREVKEELDVAISLDTAAHLGTYRAQAHDKPPGVEVRMACYTADYQGTLAASNEIAELAWLTFADRDRVALVDQLLFDDLHRAGTLR